MDSALKKHGQRLRELGLVHATFDRVYLDSRVMSTLQFVSRKNSRPSHPTAEAIFNQVLDILSLER